MGGAVGHAGHRRRRDGHPSQSAAVAGSVGSSAVVVTAPVKKVDMRPEAPEPPTEPRRPPVLPPSRRALIHIFIAAVDARPHPQKTSPDPPARRPVTPAGRVAQHRRRHPVRPPSPPVRIFSGAVERPSPPPRNLASVEMTWSASPIRGICLCTTLWMAERLPGHNSTDIWGGICGQLGPPVDGSGDPRNHPPTARSVHRSNPRLAHRPARPRTCVNGGCPHNPQHLLLLLSLFSLKEKKKLETGVGEIWGQLAPRPPAATPPRMTRTRITLYGWALQRGQLDGPASQDR